MSISAIARGIATQCWCEPRTSSREMDVELAAVFAKKLDEYISVLIRCRKHIPDSHPALLYDIDELTI